MCQSDRDVCVKNRAVITSRLIDNRIMLYVSVSQYEESLNVAKDGKIDIYFHFISHICMYRFHCFLQYET